MGMMAFKQLELSPMPAIRGLRMGLLRRVSDLSDMSHRATPAPLTSP